MVTAGFLRLGFLLSFSCFRDAVAWLRSEPNFIPIWYMGRKYLHIYIENILIYMKMIMIMINKTVYLTSYPINLSNFQYPDSHSSLLLFVKVIK